MHVFTVTFLRLHLHHLLVLVTSLDDMVRNVVGEGAIAYDQPLEGVYFLIFAKFCISLLVGLQALFHNWYMI